ncbi:MAG: alpha/beta hydrolase [Dehalococcoidia bacterium]|nr:alpha/beta hydrolase [Dehalococcoidia bacterium]
MKLVFVHGSGETGVVWRHQTDKFVDSEAVNLPGHLSDGEACSSVEEYTKWLRGYLLKKGYSNPVLAGHSLGGAIVLQYALDYPQNVGGLILAGTGAKLRVAPHVLQAIENGIKDPDSWMREFIEPQLRYIVDRVVGFATRETGMDSNLRQAVQDETAMVGALVQVNDFRACDNFNIIDKVKEITAPTLVLAGSWDVLTPPKYGAFLAENIAGARMVVIEGGTHHFFAEKPEPTNSAIEEFLKAL